MAESSGFLREVGATEAMRSKRGVSQRQRGLMVVVVVIWNHSRSYLPRDDDVFRVGGRVEVRAPGVGLEEPRGRGLVGAHVDTNVRGSLEPGHRVRYLFEAHVALWSDRRRGRSSKRGEASNTSAISIGGADEKRAQRVLVAGFVRLPLSAESGRSSASTSSLLSGLCI